MGMLKKMSPSHQNISQLLIGLQQFEWTNYRQAPTPKSLKSNTDNKQIWKMVEIMGMKRAPSLPAKDNK